MRFLFPLIVATAQLVGVKAGHADATHGTSLPVRHFAQAENAVNFVTLGDWGEVNDDQAEVASVLGATARKVNAHFLVALGDNFYENGVTSDTDPQWADTYENVFTDNALQIPWYAILGNHDHHNGNGQGEVDYYLNKRDSRWTMPSFWYDQVLSFPTTSGTVTVHWVFIDTVVLGGDYSNERREYMIEQVNPVTQQSQLDWIESVLSNSTADWLFVAGHYPVYSGGEHGDTQELQQDLMPLLEKYNVDAYYCGHDHTLQHLQSNNVNYWLSGNGAKEGTYSAIDQSLFGVVDPGFSWHQINKTHMYSEFIDMTGQTVYSYTQAINAKTYRQTPIVAMQ